LDLRGAGGNARGGNPQLNMRNPGEKGGTVFEKDKESEGREGKALKHWQKE